MVVRIALAAAFAVAASPIAPHGADFPAVVRIYTYDGPVDYTGPMIDFAYSPDGLLLVMRQDGDGIFHDGFDPQE